MESVRLEESHVTTYTFFITAPVVIQTFKTGIFLCLYPYHLGFDLPYVLFPLRCKSSIALAHFTSSASDHAVPMSARPKGIPVEELTLAGSVIIG